MSDRPAIVRYGDACFRYRGLMLPAAVLLLFIPSPPVSSNAVLTGLVGLGLALIGQFVRIANVGMVYIIRGGRNHQVYADTLVTGGLYNHVRNPMYVGNTFLLAGIAVASNAWVFAIGGLLIGVAVHVGIIAAEEHFLRGKFGGQYVDYCRRVPRLVPRLAGLAKSLEGVTFNGGRVIDKEYMEPVDWLSATALVAIIALWRAKQLHVGWPVLLIGLVVIVARLALWRRRKARQRVTTAGDAAPPPAG